MKLQNNEWYESLVEECQAIMTESIFNHKWLLIEGYHKLGTRIREEEENMPVSELVVRIAKDLDMSERNVWSAVQFADKYPDMNALPGGKAITWNKVKMLISGKKIENCQHQETKTLVICKNCNKRV